MKTINIIFGAALLSAALCSCGDDNPEPDFPDPLYVSEAQVDFEKTADRQQLHILSHNITWEIVGDPWWVTISPRAGATSTVVTLEAQMNPVQADRRDTIYVNSTDQFYPASYMVVLRQHAATPTGN